MLLEVSCGLTVAVREIRPAPDDRMSSGLGAKSRLERSGIHAGLPAVLEDLGEFLLRYHVVEPFGASVDG